MRASQLVAALQHLMKEAGADPEVGAQTPACCSAAHDIDRVEHTSADDRFNPSMIVLRCSC